jgi:hypothetical protein
MKDFGYFAPTDVKEALKFLAEYGEKTTVLAGGTDLVPRINYYGLRKAQSCWKKWVFSRERQSKGLVWP